MMTRSTKPPALALGLTLLLTPAPGWAATTSAGTDPIGMFMGAETVVQAVMLILVTASFVSWALCVVKSREIGRGIHSVHAAVLRLGATDRIDALGDLGGDVAAMMKAAQDEIKLSRALIREGRVEGVGQRVGDRIARIEQNAFAAMRRGLPVFASIGSVGPFIGLFGTVWGIMHSFVGISGSQSTNLAVVAPGISEALLATALGLVAAIPATIMYNYLLRCLARYREELETGATLLIGLVGREVELMAVRDQREGGA